MANRARLRLFLAIVTVVGGLVALVWALSKGPGADQVAIVTLPSPSPVVPAVTERELAVPSPIRGNGPSAESQPAESTPTTAITPQPSPAAPYASASLLIPVAGVRPDQLRDTFQDARSEGRSHDAIDIPASRGTPVLAAADGRIIKLFQSALGGTTIYQLGTDNRSVYYYAHLDRYADGLSEGHFAPRGEVIGYVGDTGNAGAGNYHLHFSILIVADPKRYWDGTNINPYPLLRGTP
jgi:murein DD-endopeptidase MepM/ murein hydrolase activator NlpD